MMDLSVIRRENLRQYIKENFKNRAEFAGKIGKQPSQTAMWFMTGDGRRNIGEKLARNIESSLNLPHGWMDQLHGTETTKEKATTDISSLMKTASPRTAAMLETIETAYIEGRLTDEDLDLLETIARKISRDKNRTDC